MNYFHQLLHRVDSGWDPISEGYAAKYSAESFGLVENDHETIARLETLMDGLAGKRVLDLGGGPGQYSTLFANVGARVTWHDISREYQKMAKKRAVDKGVTLEFSLGYLEEAKKFTSNPFDLVFCRHAWYYSRGDRAFGRLIYDLVRPGGVGYIECNTSKFSLPTGLYRFQCWLNEYFWAKIGHPMPPHGRIAAIIQKYPLRELALDYRSDLTDTVIFVKAFRRVNGKGFQEKF